MISNYTGPVKLIHGEKDSCVPICYSEKAKKVYKDVSFNVIKGAGHGFDGEDSKFAREQSIVFIKEHL